MKPLNRERIKRNLRRLTIRQVEGLESRQLLTSITEFAIPSSTPRPTYITSGSDGNLWFVEQNGNKVGRITTAGTVTEFSLPSGSAPEYITSGPDGNLWFADPGNDTIGRITTAGTITEFNVPTASSNPSGITAGPDGALWFSEATGNKIGRITTSGSFTEFTGDGTVSGPGEIVTGADGNLWFTESGDQIGKIVPSGVNQGVVSAYPTSAGSAPRGITAGADGNIWFTESGTNFAGMVTTTGAVTEFSLPNGSDYPSEITSGPAGHLFISEDNSNTIVEISTAGALVNQYTIPTSSSSPDGITEGPDGNIWFVEYIGDQVARLVESAASTLSVAAASGVYGATTNLSATLTSASIPVAGESVDFHLGSTDLGPATTNASGVATIPAASLGSLDAGAYVGDVTASFAGDANFAASTGTSNLTVTPAPLTVIVNNATKVYGQANPTLTGTVTGILNGDDVTPVYSTTAAQFSDVQAGGYPIYMGLAGPKSSDYSTVVSGGSKTDGILTVTPAPLTVIVNNATKVYGQASPTLTGAVSGFLNGDDVAPTFVTTAAQFSDVKAGGYPITLAGLTGPKAVDYSTSVVGGSLTQGTLTVTPAPLVVAADNLSKVYGQANPAFTGTVTGALDGDSLTAVFTSLAGQFSDVNAGGYPIILEALQGPKAVDYSTSVTGGSVTSGVLTLTPAPLRIQAAGQSKVYGQANPALTGLVAGVLNGDDVNAAFGTSAAQFSDVQAGGYPILPTGLTGTKAVDYSYQVEGASVVPGNLAITPAPLAVAIGSVSRPYGQANPTLTGTASGILNGDDVTPQYATTATASSDVQAGGYPITLTGIAGAKASDYTVTSSTPAILTVTPAPLTVTISDASKVYGQADPTLTASYTGFVLGQGPDALTGTLGQDTSATTASPVGSYPVTPTGLTSTNYAINFAPGQLSVTPAPLTVTADDATKVYGQAVPTLSATYSGFVNGDTAASLTAPVALSTTAGGASHVGSYPITPGGATSGNYAIQYVPGTLSVTPATLTVTPADEVKPYGAPVTGLTVNYNGLVNGDTALSLTTPVTASTTATASSDFGTYPITTVGGSSPDYTIVHGQGTLSIPTDPAENAYVTSLYQAILRRAPETSGLDSFLAKLNTGTSQSDVAAQIFSSPEAAALRASQGLTAGTTTPTQVGLVTALYQAILGRTPEPSGLNGWLTSLASGATPSAVAAAIEGSPEAGSDRASATPPAPPTHDQQVAVVDGLYQVILDRTPDPQGLAGWVSKLEAGATPSAVAAAIEGSPEAIADRASLAGIAFVNSLYGSILGRTPETPGLDGWLARLAGGEDDATVAQQIYDAPESVMDRAQATTTPITEAAAFSVAEQARANARLG